MEKTKAAVAAAKQKGFPKIALGVFAALMLVGIACWGYQLVTGPYVVGLTDDVSWGINICLFTFFVGLSAGGLIVASSAHVFQIESFKEVALPAVITSTVCICCALGYILVDLGAVQRVWRMFTGPNFASPLMWDVLVIGTYLVINILDIIWIAKGDEKKVRILSWVALPVAFLVHSVTAWIFALQIGRAWYSAIMAPIFVVSALDSGLALLLIELVILNKTKLFSVSKELFTKLARLLCVFVALDAFLLGCELLTMGYPGAGEAGALAIMTSGATAPFFWFEIVLGLIVPFCVLVVARNRESTGLVVGMSVLIVLGVLCKRVWLMFTSLIAPFGIPAEDGTLLYVNDFGALFSIYTPTLVESLIAIGVLSMGILAFMALCNVLLGGKKLKAKKVEAAKAAGSEA